MRRVCYHCRWVTACNSCETNGINCVYITPTEKVVCWHTGFLVECPNNPICTTIDGSNVVIRDRHQILYRLDGRPLQGSDRHDSMWQCRLRNDSFQLGLSTLPNGPYSETALIIMDMWDKHPGPGSSLRVGQLAKAINEFANFLRERGALIIHSPSERGVYDVNNKLISQNARIARGNAIEVHNVKSKKWLRERFFYLGSKHLNEAFDHIIEGTGEEWPSESNPATGSPTYENAQIDIRPEDAISATMLDLGTSSANAYPELLALTQGKPNLIYCGVHTNLCLLARPNSMRTMAKAGKSLWLVRDLTDASVGGSSSGLTEYASLIDGSENTYRYNSYNHFEATDLVVDWIGRNVGAETWTSDVATGGTRFRFPGPFGDNPNRVWPRV